MMMSGMAAETHASSWLFVPGSRPERFAKAAEAGAGEVIIDLEDAVEPELKETAREQVAGRLGEGLEAWVRVNAAGTPWHDDDLAALGDLPALRGVVVPKAEDPVALLALAARLAPGTGLLALVETAVGVREVDAVATCPATSRLAFGSVDLALDLSAEDEDDVMLYARSAIVIASRAADLPAPVDGVTLAVHDDDAIVRDAERARRRGFGGKLCIHPRQVAAVERAFAPSAAELEYSRRVLAEAEVNSGAFTVDGQMIDRPMIERAKRLLAAADGK
jgi:citrate lyase subunit beta/citryl-CoA lyase